MDGQGCYSCIGELLDTVSSSVATDVALASYVDAEKSVKIHPHISYFIVHINYYIYHTFTPILASTSIQFQYQEM